MKSIGVFLFGLLSGTLMGWFLSSGSFPYVYQTTRPLMLLDNTGVKAGVLPAESVLVAEVELVRAPDLGWWGFVPVLFDTMQDAQDLGLIPWTGEKTELWREITLYARRSVDSSVENEE